MIINKSKLILASGSESRSNLLKRINIEPAAIIISNIDETPLPKEKPCDLAKRLAKLKAEYVANNIEEGFIVGADTVSACGRKILPKAMNDKDVEYCLNLISGRKHQVHTAIYIIKKEHNQIVAHSSRIVTSKIKFKRLSQKDIKEYVASKQGIGKGGGCAVEGLLEKFIPSITGSYSNIIGLPLYETASVLEGMGFKNGDV